MKSKYKNSVRDIEIENCKRILKLHDLNKNGNEDLKSIVEDKLSMLQEKVEEQWPKKGESYWLLDSERDIYLEDWDGGEIDQFRLKLGLIFKTKSEAEVRLKEVMEGK